MTPISESGYVHAGRGLNEICIDAGVRITRDSAEPSLRFNITDSPLKMPDDGAVTMVVTPLARFAPMSSSDNLTFRAASNAGEVSGAAASSGRCAAFAPR